MPSPCHCTTLRLGTRKLSAVYDAALAPLGINIAQYSLLRTIRRQQPMSLTALGHAQALDRSTIGRNVRVLERLRLVEASRDDQDQRQSVIRLTENGADLLNRAFPIWEDCQRIIEARLGADRLRDLHEALNAI